ncbi:hypothetical protein, partial [Novosphingobium sp.]|uniref:hypothetical protein n=1 Tax=Novosphingobium sp. TaxID=1874826 RepID=UPI002FDECD76
MIAPLALAPLSPALARSQQDGRPVDLTAQARPLPTTKAPTATATSTVPTTVPRVPATPTAPAPVPSGA